jgi:hypothetical protein
MMMGEHILGNNIILTNKKMKEAVTGVTGKRILIDHWV